jgi:5-methylcytosine-specific restriction endonuclease McrA
VTWQQAVWYYAKERVAWEMGREEFTFWGGRCHRTGERSSITANSIIAIRGKALAIKGFNQVPPLNNRELFNRDKFVCAFCGGDFSHYRLTCDHIVPMSRGGRDSWMNVVTACRACNQKKGSRTPEEAHMQLLYAPYVPNRAEFLILGQPPDPGGPDGVSEAARIGQLAAPHLAGSRLHPWPPPSRLGRRRTLERHYRAFPRSLLVASLFATMTVVVLRNALPPPSWAAGSRSSSASNALRLSAARKFLATPPALRSRRDGRCCP